MITLDQLPLYILVPIFDHLYDMEDYLAIRRTCKKFKVASSQHSFITQERFADFQKCQRKLYQRLAVLVPKDGRWELQNCAVPFLCKMMNIPSIRYPYSSPWMERVCAEFLKVSEFWTIGYKRADMIYNDVLHKMANTNFTILNLSNNDLNYGLFDDVFKLVRANTTNIKLKELVLRNTLLTNLSCLGNIQDLFDNCCLYLNGTCFNYKHYKKTITGVALVFDIDSLNRKTTRRIFRDNDGKPSNHVTVPRNVRLCFQH